MKKTELKFSRQPFYHFARISICLSLFFWFQNVSAQSITISPSSVSSIQTSRSANNIDLIKTGTSNTSGFRFYQSASLRGGLFYSDSENIINFSHTPNTAGIVWNTDSQRAGIGVKLPQGRLHILTNSTDTVPHLLIQENNDGDGGRLNFENFGVANKHWTLYGRNSNSALPSANAFNIYHSSFGNVAQFTGDGNTRMNGNTLINGFTQLGTDAPGIKVKKFTGILDNDEETRISIDISPDKIVSFNGHVFIDGIPPRKLILPGDPINAYNYRLQIGDFEIHFDSVPEVLRLKPYVVYITFEE